MWRLSTHLKLQIGTWLLPICLLGVPDTSFAEPPPSSTAPPVPTEDWVTFGEAVDGAEQLSYNQLDSRAIEFVSVLRAMEDHMKAMESQIDKLNDSIPDADADELNRIAQELTVLIERYPNGLPEELTAQAIQMNTRMQELFALHQGTVEKIEALSEQYQTYYRTVYEPKWAAFEACSCSRKVY